MPQVYLTNSEGTFDLSELVTKINWSGDYRQCARTLDIGLVSSPYDSKVPEVDCKVGCGIVLEEEGETLFDGYVMSRTKSTVASVIDLVCYDRGFYLKKIEVAKKYVGATPEGVARTLCAEYGIPVGELAVTGANISRNFPGYSLWDIIRTMYTLASEVTKKKYHIGFVGTKLQVRVKAPGESTIIIAGGSNLMDATTTESVENMVNSVAVYDQSGNLLQTLQHKENIKLYGLMQQAIKQTKESVAPKAQQLLDEGDVEQKITVNNLGDISCTAGNCVVVQEPYTGLYGLFYIDTDTHSWKNGVYTNKLIVNFKAMMDEKTVGEIIK
ncbi:hypothetical protein [Hydrogenoanaerobacterium sp.]|uniref:XkdQ/YqbQ family protein n=1 Tax=Hydrogenoanaerobacterium sp. TaxID=2953763 RepID=UPI00289F9B71|nr:hypothetical protein [Hydrogenoanaerobacterium sp.]